MWALFVVVFGLVAGLGASYKYTHKKKVPLIKFVPKTDRERVLKEYGLRIGKSSKCSVCGDSITLKNLGAIMRNEAKITFVCSKSQCMTLSDLLTPTTGAHTLK